MKPEARQLVKLLKFDARQAAGQAALRTYFPATVRASSYPDLLVEDVPGLAVKAFLVTYYDYGLSSTVVQMRKIARSLCQNFALLQASGHAKWREVELALPELRSRLELLRADGARTAALHRQHPARCAFAGAQGVVQPAGTGAGVVPVGDQLSRLATTLTPALSRQRERSLQRSLC